MMKEFMEGKVYDTLFCTVFKNLCSVTFQLTKNGAFSKAYTSATITMEEWDELSSLFSAYVYVVIN